MVALPNPAWSRDELIVTLDFYLQHSPSLPGKNSEAILALSTFLNQLQSKLGGDIPDKFRNLNGVYMKLMNFRRLDPSYEGQGLQRGNKDEGVVWGLYAHRTDELRRVANTIRSYVLSDDLIPQVEFLYGDEEEGTEGRVLTRLHRYRERDPVLVRRKKQQALKEHTTLFCEVCGFDFEGFYGSRGQGFIECHHTKPLSELPQHGETTRISDLSLVCSNCHRMIHRHRPWLSPEELRELMTWPNSANPG